MQQVVRTLTLSEENGLPHVVICDRDGKWSHDVRRHLRDAGMDLSERWRPVTAGQIQNERM